MIPQPSCFDSISRTNKKDVKNLCISFCKSKNYSLTETKNFLLILRTAGHVEDHSLAEDEFKTFCTEFSCEIIKNKYRCDNLCSICPYGGNININKVNEENVLAYLIQNSNVPKTTNNLSEKHLKSSISINNKVISIVKILYRLLPFDNSNISLKLKNVIKDEQIYKVAMAQYTELKNRKVDKNLFNKSLSDLLSNPKSIDTIEELPIKNQKTQHMNNNNHISKNNSDNITINPKKNIKSDTFMPLSHIEINELYKNNYTNINNENTNKEKMSLHNKNIVTNIHFDNKNQGIKTEEYTEIEKNKEDKKIEVDNKATSTLSNVDIEEKTKPSKIVSTNNSDAMKQLIPSTTFLDKYELITDFSIYNEQIHYSLLCCKILYLEYYPTNEDLLYIHYRLEDTEYYYKLYLKNIGILKRFMIILANDFITKVSYSFVYLQCKYRPYKTCLQNCFDIKLAYTLVNPTESNSLSNIIKHFTNIKNVLLETSNPILVRGFGLPLYKTIYKKLKKDIEYNQLNDKYNDELLFNYFIGISLSMPIKEQLNSKTLINHYSYDYLYNNNLNSEKLLSIIPKDYTFIDGIYSNIDTAISKKFSNNTPFVTFNGYDISNLKQYKYELIQELYRYTLIEILKNIDIWYLDVFLVTCNKEKITLACKKKIQNILFDALNQSMSLIYKKYIQIEYPEITISIY